MTTAINFVVPLYEPPLITGTERNWIDFGDKALGRREIRHETADEELFVRYGWQQIEPQEPYLSVVADLTVDGDLVETGQQVRARVEAMFPWLRKLYRWHLCSTDEPMHYVANSIYWWNKINETTWYGIDPVKAFSDTCILGALPDDLITVSQVINQVDLTKWLDDRKAGVMAAMWADAAAYGLVKERIE